MRKRHRHIYTSRLHKSILAAFEYYESAQKDLGDYFLSSLEECITSIDSYPEIYKTIYKSYRQAKVKRFPYVVIFRLNDDEIIIENVFNTYQNPIKKQNSLEATSVYQFIYNMPFHSFFLRKQRNHKPRQPCFPLQ